jgi:hypothetical protein
MKVVSKVNKIFNLIILILIGILYLYIFAFYSFVLRAYFTLSRWPSYNNPDPSLFNFELHQELVYLSLNISIISFCLIIILFFVSFLIKTSINRVNWYLILIAICIIIYNIVFDPFMEWFAD